MGRRLRQFKRLGRRSQLAIVVLSLLSAGLGGRLAIKGLLALANEYLEEKSEEWAREGLKHQSLRNCLAKLKRGGLVNNESRGVWEITSEGNGFLKNIEKEKGKIKPIVPKGPPDTIVIFDVPEKESWKRKILRYQLILFGFRQLQKSVLIGSGPLPEEFINYLGELEILPFVHIFSIKEPGTIEV